jgi:hypothetical protein
MARRSKRSRSVAMSTATERLTLAEHPEPAVIPGEDPQTIAAVTEQKEMSPEGIPIKGLARQSREAIGRAAEIGYPGRQIDANRQRSVSTATVGR